MNDLPFRLNLNFKSRTIFTDWSDREFIEFIYSKNVDNKTKELNLFAFIQLIIQNGEINLKESAKQIDSTQIEWQTQYCLLLEKVCECLNNDDFVDLSATSTIDSCVHVIEQLIKLDAPHFEYFRTKSISNIVHNLVKYRKLEHFNDEQMRRLIGCMSTKLNKYTVKSNDIHNDDDDDDDDELRVMRRANGEIENSYRFRCESLFSLDEPVFLKHLNEIQQFYL